MTAKFVLLAVAALSLIACETTEHTDVAAPPGPVSRIVVRGAVVPDEPDPLPPKHRTKHAVAKAAAVATPATDATAPETASAPVETVPAAAPVEAAPAPSDTASAGASASAVDAAPAAEAPAVETATPTSPTADSNPVTPGWRTSDIPVLIQALIGGVPLWMMALIGVVLFAAFAFGMSGGRKTDESESRHEPEAA